MTPAEAKTKLTEGLQKDRKDEALLKKLMRLTMAIRVTDIQKLPNGMVSQVIQEHPLLGISAHVR